MSRVIQPEERAVRDFASDHEWAKGMFRDVAHDETPPECDKDAETARQIAKLIDADVAAGWELIRESAEETLKTNPDDDTAQAQMLSYKQYKRQQQLPPERRNALIVTTGSKTRTEPVGVWARATDGKFYIRIARSEVGDVIKVKSKSGEIQKMKLTECVAVNLYKGRGV